MPTESEQLFERRVALYYEGKRKQERLAEIGAALVDAGDEDRARLIAEFQALTAEIATIPDQAGELERRHILAFLAEQQAEEQHQAEEYERWQAEYEPLYQKFVEWNQLYERLKVEHQGGLRDPEALQAKWQPIAAERKQLKPTLERYQASMIRAEGMREATHARARQVGADLRQPASWPDVARKASEKVRRDALRLVRGNFAELPAEEASTAHR